MNESVSIIKVGIADMKIASMPDILRTSGLGSCVGAAVYDQSSGLAGMAHIMLPDSSLARAGSINKLKYADTAIEELVRQMARHGASVGSLKAKIAGGAQMFQFTSGSDLMRIGPRNVEAVKTALQVHHIRLIAEDVGGNSGRTIEFSPKTSMLQIKTVNKGVTEL
ncbi:chemotaxis protein CheD [Bacillus infantis]|uniref:chemotaxis protein CheD n=1 Tax=Bacillus infantis TaxID=324767 RepID=UPI001CD68C25|nr:chemotaxis protein CheD [Bacillus infantis]MCA1040798.1 chemotaxis protein CheD [Bacillus infantis]